MMIFSFQNNAKIFLANVLSEHFFMVDLSNAVRREFTSL